MARRMEAVQTEAQHAVSTSTREVEALDLVEGQWFQVLPAIPAAAPQVCADDYDGERNLWDFVTEMEHLVKLAVHRIKMKRLEIRREAKSAAASGAAASGAAVRGAAAGGAAVSTAGGAAAGGVAGGGGTAGSSSE
eukprot:6703522-Prymnesium_polylepis.1